MPELKTWVQAARIRTLPLSISGILTGTAIATIEGEFDLSIFIFALLTTIAFQVTSNYANDYGDGIKGTDNADRIGPKRMLQEGSLSSGQLLVGITISSIISAILAMTVIYFAFRDSNLIYPLVFSFLGVASIWAAIRYTVGKQAYGYRGLGDVFVFIFFGLLSVLGSQFLYTKAISEWAILPASAIGLLSTGVLNLNNMRDLVSDQKAGKNTIVVKIGMAYAKKYHYALLTMAFLCMSSYIGFAVRSWKVGLCLLAFVPIGVHMIRIMKIRSAAEFDPELKKLALSTFFLALLFYIGCKIFL